MLKEVDKGNSCAPEKRRRMKLAEKMGGGGKVRRESGVKERRVGRGGEGRPFASTE